MEAVRHFHGFVDYKKIRDSVRREVLCNILSEFNTLMRLLLVDNMLK